MAIRFDSGDKLTRSTSLPGVTSWTMMCWCYLTSDTNAYAGVMNFEGTTVGFYYLVGAGSDGTTFTLYNNSVAVGGGTLTVGTWNHIAATCASTAIPGGYLGYLNGVQNISHQGDSSIVAGGLGFGRSSDGNQLDGRIAAIKVYNVVLTEAEIAAEMRQYVPVRTANLNSWYPLLSTADDDIDYSGAGLTLTVTGTLATEDGPPIPWDIGRRRVLNVTAAAPPVSDYYVLVAN